MGMEAVTNVRCIWGVARRISRPIPMQSIRMLGRIKTVPVMGFGQHPLTGRPQESQPEGERNYSAQLEPDMPMHAGQYRHGSDSL